MNVDMGAFRVFISNAIASRQKTAGDDLVSMLIRAAPGSLDEDALVDNVMLLVADMIENVWAGIASALMILIEHRSEAESFLAAGGSWNSLIDECLRLESPGQYQSRISTEPLDIGGTTLNKYSVVLVGLAAANRDPATFNDPTAFQPSRKGAKHLTFGLGRHACIGGALARQEMTAILRAMWPLEERLDLVEDTMHWEARAGHRWLRSLPLHLKS
jgi:cytochrome P450